MNASDISKAISAMSRAKDFILASNDPTTDRMIDIASDLSVSVDKFTRELGVVPVEVEIPQ